MTGRRVDCPDCGRDCAAQGLGAHRRHAHGRLTDGARDRTDRRVYAGPGPYPCPECDQGPFGTPQGLGAHRFRAHGIVGKSQNGGPGGARRRERNARRRTEAQAIAALFDGIVETYQPSGFPCRRLAPRAARFAGVPVWVAECECGYRTVGRFRYEVTAALLAHPVFAVA